MDEPVLLGASAIRQLAAELDLRPTKRWGQNFVIDANTVRRIVHASEVAEDDVVLEVGPGLGSLTLGLVAVARSVYAVEIDPALAAALPKTVASVAPSQASRLHVLNADALKLSELAEGPTALVANLPYNVAVPVLLHLLETFPSLKRGLVMVQREVADRLVAAPGSRTYGSPSVKSAWYAKLSSAGRVGRNVFWPAPNVDSGLVSFVRREPPSTSASRQQVFAVIDAAFAQRRKSLRASLAGWAGSPALAEGCLRAASIDPTLRGERLTVEQFAALAEKSVPVGP
ncbi:MAG: 16S rRNA (adenine(1518)-N(6)/adenine(1519)-N(6))-dimethyltransferase RsmA [Candidatus Nanopelagicales bacterium]